jgi:hypothetical protein
MEAFAQNLPPKISSVVTRRMNSVIQNSENMENRIEDSNVLPGSAEQTDLVASLVKTCTKNPDGTTRKKMEVKINRADQSHLVE